LIKTHYVLHMNFMFFLYDEERAVRIILVFINENVFFSRFMEIDFGQLDLYRQAAAVQRNFHNKRWLSVSLSSMVVCG
jgi:hypothetical protein